MGFFIAILIFTVSSITAVHMGHLQHQNAELNQKIETLETQEDGNSLQIDGIPVRNLSNENE